MLPRRWFPDHIDGDRVVLRRHGRENLRAFLRWYADPEVARLTRYQDGPMRSDEIERFFAMRAMGPDSLAMAFHVRETDRLIPRPAARASARRFPAAPPAGAPRCRG